MARLDRYRARFASAPDSMSNAIIVGSLLVPLGLAGRQQRFSADALERRVELGMLQMPRRDIEHLHQILALQPRLLDVRVPFRAQRALLHRHSINDALTWLEIHGDRPEVVAHWRALQSEPQTAEDPAAPYAHPRPRRRRRRRRRVPQVSPQE